MGALLAWLYANVLGNLIASAIWVTPAFLLHHVGIKRHHRDEIRKLRIQLSKEIDSLRLTNQRAGARVVSLRDLQSPEPRMPDPPPGAGGAT